MYMRYIAEYIWLDSESKLRSKTKVITNDKAEYEFKGNDFIKNFPIWNYDGSSTGQAEGLYSELYLIPKAYYKDPFRRNYECCETFLVLCETYDEHLNPLPTNTRYNANLIFNDIDKKQEEPWFGIEQEYFIFGKTGKMVASTTEQKHFYCGVGYNNIGENRKLVEEHLDCCLYAGLKISGVNAEVAPNQWEYQIGPCVGIESGDQLWVSRWIMERVSEKYNSFISWEPKPIKGINGSGCHTNFSTKKMRDENGLDEIYGAIEKLRNNHVEHMIVYGEGNNERMLGAYETASYNEFKFEKDKPVNRCASVRIGYETMKNKSGYFEDRRPASNMDPYLVTSKIFKTVTSSVDNLIIDLL